MGHGFVHPRSVHEGDARRPSSSPVVPQVFDPAVHPDTLSGWTGTLAFAGQDYCDFAGYSTCAMGIGYCLGFVLPANFHAPLASIGFRDVWQRWHITLVAWLRDYVFTPLAASTKVICGPPLT